MRTRATLRSAEFGFFGVVVKTRVQTPRRWGAVTFFLRPLPDFRPGVASFFVLALRPFRTSWLVVGMRRVMVAACIALARPEDPGGIAPRARAGIRRRRGRCRARGRGLRRKARRGRPAGGDRRGASHR